MLEIWRRHLKKKCAVNKLKAQDKASAGPPVKSVACFDKQKVPTATLVSYRVHGRV
jgi:hypothetical protein